MNGAVDQGVEIKYSNDFYGTWSPVDAQENSSVYIELDDKGRGVLEFRNEDESLGYMIHPVSESEQETVVEYDTGSIGKYGKAK